MKNTISNKQKFFLGLVVLHVFYFIIALVYKKITNDDSPEYLWQAVNIKKLWWFYSADPTQPIEPFFLSLRPPVYSFFILLANSINSSIYTILVIQNIISIGIFMLLYKVFEEYNLEVNGWKLVLIALVLSPATLRLANSVLSDSLFQAFLFLAFYMLLKYFKQNKVRHLLYYNLLLVIALFVKPSILYFWIPNVLFSIYLFYLNRKPAILLFSIFLPSAIFLWSYRNEKVTGCFHFSSITSQDIIECFAYYPLQANYGKDYADSVRHSITDSSKTIENFNERYEYMHREGIGIIKANWSTYLYIHIRGMFSFMLDPGRLEIISFFPQKPKEVIGFFNEIDKRGWIKGIWFYINYISIFLLLYLFVIFLWNIVMFISLLHFIFNRKIVIQIRIAVFILIGYVCSVSVIGGFSRFRNGILPILLFTLPFFFQFISEWYTKYRLRSRK